jgi:hypothetical protein
MYKKFKPNSKTVLDFMYTLPKIGDYTCTKIWTKQKLGTKFNMFQPCWNIKKDHIWGNKDIIRI